MENSGIKNTKTKINHNDNIEHQKELNNLEDVSHTHKGGFEKNHPKPQDMKNTKNQNN